MKLSKRNMYPLYKFKYNLSSVVKVYIHPKKRLQAKGLSQTWKLINNYWLNEGIRDLFQVLFHNFLEARFTTLLACGILYTKLAARPLLEFSLYFLHLVYSLPHWCCLLTCQSGLKLHTEYFLRKHFTDEVGIRDRKLWKIQRKIEETRT